MFHSFLSAYFLWILSDRAKRRASLWDEEIDIKDVWLFHWYISTLLKSLLQGSSDAVLEVPVQHVLDLSLLPGLNQVAE